MIFSIDWLYQGNGGQHHASHSGEASACRPYRIPASNQIMYQGNGGQHHASHSGEVSSRRPYRIPASNQNIIQNIDVVMAGSFQNHQNFLKKDNTVSEISHKQIAGVGGFISVFEDAEFLQPLKATSGELFPSSSEESDPFHSDWPYWDHK
jgi:hypothetical protein